MKRAPSRGVANERGFGLVEVLVGVVLLSSVLLSLAGAAGLAMRRTNVGRLEMHTWAAVQRKADSLMSVGWADVTDGSDVVEGRTMAWTVSGTDPRRIDVVFDRTTMSGRAVADTIILYMANPNP